MMVEVDPIEDLCENKIGYVERTNLSFIDVPGQIATVLFVRGCSIRCPDCHNCELQSFDATRETTVEKVLKKLNELELSKWICFQGGEPLDQSEFITEIIKGLNPRFKVCIYTGYGMEMVMRKYKSIMALPNVRMVKAGRFIQSKRVYDKFLATSNQKVQIKLRVDASKETQWVKLDWLNNEKQFLEKQLKLTDY